MDLIAYRQTEREKGRIGDLMRVVPKNRASILDVGARDGYVSRILTEHFPEVTALDLSKPEFDAPGVKTVAGDITHLDFPDRHFDVVFCAEVLEHIVDLEQACRELARVARYEIVIGVPFDQDTRLGRTSCAACGRTSPPYGHVNSFTRQRLLNLFPGCRLVSESYSGTKQEGTTALATWMMDLAGNPYGTYDQDETCVHCGAVLVAPVDRSFHQKVFSAVAVRLNRLQDRFTKPTSNWIHLVFEKNS